MSSEWLTFAYKVPAEPASGRVALWRKLKAMGAIYIRSGVCVLPRDAEHERRLKILENDVTTLGGEALLLMSAALDPAQERKLVARFQADCDERYGEFVGRCDAFESEIAKEFRIEKFTYAELEEEDADLKKLQAWLERIKKLDRYDSPRAQEAQGRLKGCEETLEAYAQRVFAEHAEDE